MLKQLLKGRKRSPAARKPGDKSALYRALFEFLISCISVPVNAEQLIQLGLKSSGKSAEEVFHAYLLFEKYLTSFEQVEQQNRRSLRERDRQRFPILLEEGLIFHILF